MRSSVSVGPLYTLSGSSATSRGSVCTLKSNV
jgi:hypothetical protein